MDLLLCCPLPPDAHPSLLLAGDEMGGHTGLEEGCCRMEALQEVCRTKATFCGWGTTSGESGECSSWCGSSPAVKECHPSNGLLSFRSPCA